MDLKNIQELIKLMGKNGVGKLDIKDGEFEIKLTTVEYIAAKESQYNVVQSASMPMPSMSVTAAPPPAPLAIAGDKSEVPASNSDANLITFRAPMIGTFYRSPGPDKPVFVNVGDEITKGKTICIIEAMKLFNEIEAEVSGKIVKVLIEDASPVEYDQPLFLIEPN